MSFKSIIEKVVGTYSDRELKRIKPMADKVLALDAEMVPSLFQEAGEQHLAHGLLAL